VDTHPHNQMLRPNTRLRRVPEWPQHDTLYLMSHSEESDETQKNTPPHQILRALRALQNDTGGPYC